MSHRATRWAWLVRGINSTQKIVLIKLADMANDRGEAWPGVRLLAADCCLTPRGVQKALKELEGQQLVAISHGGGMHGVSIYRLAVAELPDQEPKEPNTETQTGIRQAASVVARPPNHVHPSPRTLFIPP